MSMPWLETLMPVSNDGSGMYSMNSKRRRSAVSTSASERSAVFIEPMNRRSAEW